MKKALGLLLVAIVVLAVCGVVAWSLLLQPAPAPNVGADLPPEKTVGETFEMTVVVSNPHAEPIAVHRVDIDRTLVRGFNVLKVVPAPTDDRLLPIEKCRSWRFDREVAPGNELTITFAMQPIEAGRFAGKVEVLNKALDGTSADAAITIHKK